MMEPIVWARLSVVAWAKIGVEVMGDPLTKVVATAAVAGANLAVGIGIALVGVVGQAGADPLTVGGSIGLVLSGVAAALALARKMFVDHKVSDHYEALIDQLRDERDTALVDRDYWRDLALAKLNHPSRPINEEGTAV